MEVRELSSEFKWGSLVKKEYHIDENGYYRHNDSGELVHRYIASRFVVHRRLRSNEVVHHINGNKLDNRPENLRVMTSDEHDVQHQETWNEERSRAYQEPGLDYAGFRDRFGISTKTSGYTADDLACIGSILWGIAFGAALYIGTRYDLSLGLITGLSFLLVGCHFLRLSCKAYRGKNKRF
jgi:hypothetical protein